MFDNGSVLLVLGLFAAGAASPAGALSQHEAPQARMTPTAPEPAGQDAGGPHPQHQHPQQPAPHDPSQHAAHEQDHRAPARTPATREGSGTSWLPDASPMAGWHGRRGEWELMAHGTAFVQYLFESGERGSNQGGSVNWFMASARRDAGIGRIGVRGMLSLEPWTVPGCGYPDLLATGEVCDGDAIHDRQHPHDLVMELAADYERPLNGSTRLHLYGGLAGEPALGPVAYPHRPSSVVNVLAPIAHHWLDATHVTFGVFTAGVSGSRWKVEGSVFNGREPDEDRANLDLGRPDSVSGRVWFLPAPSLSLQFSAGHLNEAEAGHDGEPRVDVDRITASATYHRMRTAGDIWASTAAYGRNTEEGQATHALLLETSLTRHDRETWFGRFEIAGKPAHDLDIHGTDRIFTVSKLQLGYTYHLRDRNGLRPGVGGALSLGFVPGELEAAYGRRVNPGFALFFVVRPSVHRAIH